MRSISTVLFILFYTIGSIPKYIKLKYFTRDKSKQNEGYHRFVTIWARRLLNVTGTTMDIKGLDNIPANTPVLFVGNHQSYFDIPALVAIIDKPIGFIAKIELKKIPIFSKWITSIGSVFIDRNDIRQSLKAIIQSTDNLKNGLSMVIFPEGTRSKSDDMGDFKKGSLKPAVKANVPIIPVAINGTHRIYESNKSGIKKATIRITFGEPIMYSELPKEIQRDSGNYVQNIIKDML